jgi:hypothetical protein
MIFALAVITYPDRLRISAAMPAVAVRFNLTPDCDRCKSVTDAVAATAP